MYKFFWKVLGILSLIMAYIGVITPGVPFSIFVVFAAYCFSKGSPSMHTWLYNHKLFGPFLTNWTEHRVFPTRFKFVMIWMMILSLGIMWASNVKLVGIMSTAIFMMLVAIWAWRYPGSVEEYNTRKSQGNRIGWLK
jgi:uncharacterized membrane protein YbaN (DUF454 family)